MTTINFTKNYNDHSNAQGYQFEFFCDKCGNGYRSSFAANKLGMASSFLSAASDLFGGALSQAANAGNQLKDALRGKAWDDAFKAAIDECKPKFRQCRRCGKWVCPEICWNEKSVQCKECAPDLQEEAASVQAQVAKSQLADKAGKVDLTGGVDFKKPQGGACPHCNAAVSGGKFCPACGKPLAAASACPKCKAQIPEGAKFCGECGSPRG